MKYTISAINQLGIAHHGLTDKTDIVDWALLDYVFDWQQNPKASLCQGGLAWLSYKHICEELPLLGLKTKSAVSMRMTKLRGLGLLETYQDPNNQRIYGKTTARYFEVTRFKNSDQNFVNSCASTVHENEHPVHENEQVFTKMNTPVHFDEHPVHENEHRTVYTNNSNTNEQNIRARAREDVLALLAFYSIVGDLADDFIKHRKLKKSVITKTAMEGFKREAGKAGLSVAEAVRLAIERGWTGFRAEWVVNKTINHGGNYAKFNGPSESEWNNTNF